MNEDNIDEVTSSDSRDGNFNSDFNIIIERISDSSDGTHPSTEIIRKERLEDIHLKYSKTDSVWIQKKWLFIICVFILNIGLVMLTVFTNTGFYTIIPFITLSHVRDIIYIFIAIFAHAFGKSKRWWGRFVELERIDKFKPIVVASIVTCYCEHYPTVKETVQSLLYTQSDYNIQNIVFCVCDGSVIGKENDKPLSVHFEEDMEILGPPITRTYETWKGDIVKARILYGKLQEQQDSLFVLIQKQQNHGKKDSLLLAKGFLKTLNEGGSRSAQHITNHIQSTIKYVFCTDADTLIGESAIERAVLGMEQYPDLDANVSQLRVRFHSRSWFWDPLQHFQYFSSQFVRRATESVFGKVTCLSGSGNVCRMNSEAYNYANTRYAEYPRTTSILDVVPKMIGTDRRYTTLMLKYSKDTKTAMQYDSHVYTETPQNLWTYVSQRKRWGTNTISNSFVNIASRNIPWYVKLSGIVDILRLVASYYRVVSYVFFWAYITNINVNVLIFVATTIGFVYIYTFIGIFLFGERKLILCYGFVINKILTPLFTVLIFTNILKNFDDFRWGKTQESKGEMLLDIEDARVAKLKKREKSRKDPKEMLQTIGESVKDALKDKNTLMFEENVVGDVGEVETNSNRRKKKRIRKIRSDSEHQKRLERIHSEKFRGTPIEKFDDRNYTDDLKEIRARELLDGGSTIRSISPNSVNVQDVGRVKSKFTKEWLQENFPTTEEDICGETGGETDSEDIIVYSDDDCDGSGVPLPPPPPPVVPVPPPPPPPPPVVPNPTQPLKPKRRTKTLRWDPIPQQITTKTFWRLSSTNLKEIRDWDTVEDEMKSLFELKNVKVNMKNTQTSKNVQLVNMNRANNAGIILRYIRRHFSSDDKCLGVVFDAITNLKNDQISLDQLYSFIRLFPLDKKEKRNIDEFKSKEYDYNKLSLVNKFFIRVVELPDLQNRIQSSIIKRTVPTKLKNLRRNFIIIQNACIELKESVRFKEFLKVVLKFGKLLNKGTYLGQDTVGFKLSTLSRLKSLRSQSKSINLLEYIVKKIENTQSDILNFKDDLPSLELASTISFEDLSVECGSVFKSIETVKDTLGRCKKITKKTKENIKKMNKTFWKRFMPFYKFAEERKKHLVIRRNETETVLSKLMRYYGEDLKETPSNVFFGMILKFAEDVKEVISEFNE